MAWSTPISMIVGGLAGELVGDIVKEYLKENNYSETTQNIVSGVAEGITVLAVGESINVAMIDPIGATAVTPAQAAVQGAARAIKGESIAKPIVNAVLQSFGHEGVPALPAPTSSVPALAAPIPNLGHIAHYPEIFEGFRRK